MIKGYEDGTFRPNNTITRAEVAAITNRMLGRSADEEYVDAHTAQLRTFGDLRSSYWAYYEIVEATNGHDYETTEGTENWTALFDTTSRFDRRPRQLHMQPISVKQRRSLSF